MKTAKKDELEKGKAPAEKEEGTGEEQKEEGGEEEEDEEEESEKSVDVTADDLEKSLAQLQNFIEEGDAPTRKEVLLKKAQGAEGLDKSERQELFEILGGGGAGEGSALAGDIEKAMEPSDDLQKALDVSDFLSETHEETKRVFGVLGDRIEKSDARQHDFNILLAKGVADVGGLLKSIDQRLRTIEGQPARLPKSKTPALQKSFAGQQPQEESNLSKSVILDTMSDMIEKSCNAGGGGYVDGIDLIQAASKYEQFNQIHPTVLGMVKKQVKGAVH